MTSSHAPINAVAPSLRSEGDSVQVVSEQLRAAWAKLAELGHADAIKSALVDAARSLHSSFRELRTKYAPGSWRARLASLTPDGRRRLQEYSWLEDLGRLFEAAPHSAHSPHRAPSLGCGVCAPCAATGTSPLPLPHLPHRFEAAFVNEEVGSLQELNDSIDRILCDGTTQAHTWCTPTPCTSPSAHC